MRYIYVKQTLPAELFYCFTITYISETFVENKFLVLGMIIGVKLHCRDRLFQSWISANFELSLTHCFSFFIFIHLFISKLQGPKQTGFVGFIIALYFNLLYI